MSLSSPTAATPNPLEVYELADLRHWEQLRAGPSLGVLGHPVAHSVSPQMHNAALAHLRAASPDLIAKLQGLEYFKFDIEPAGLAEALDLLRKKNFWGVNLTVPLKEKAAALVAQLARGKDDIGIRSINTLKPVKDGWEGHNTDGYGLVQALERELQVKLRGKTVVILGAGGAAHGSAVECLRQGCAALWVGNRGQERLEHLLKELRAVNQLLNASGKGKRAPRPDEAIRGFALAEPPAKAWPADVVVINATTLGMQREDSAPLDPAVLGAQACVFDMIYRRGGKKTALAAMASARGLRAADGVAMLVWQGAASFTIWLHAHLEILIKPQSIAQVMMKAASEALGLKHPETPPHA
ncbi:MAG: shikimate dehydrogenase [Opitutales bacterium]|jgi:shikimate dehydrogenase